MPIGKHFGGRGEKVMAAMRKEYGTKEGERVFYATENKRKKKKKPNKALEGLKKAHQ